MKMKRAQERNGVSEEKNEATETWRRGLEGRLVCLFVCLLLISVGALAERRGQGASPPRGESRRPLRSQGLARDAPGPERTLERLPASLQRWCVAFGPSRGRLYEAVGSVSEEAFTRLLGLISGRADSGPLSPASSDRRCPRADGL